MTDNLAQLDQSGTNCQFVRTWLGPTIGWVDLPVYPEVIISSAAALTIQPFYSRVLLNAAVIAVQLPDVALWLKANYQRNLTGFDRSLWIKDLAGNWELNNCVVTPFGAQTIDGQATYTAVNNYDLFRLYPLTNLSGWYRG